MKKEETRPLISFDWAMKSILRQKSSFEILEGLFSTILQEDIKIDAIIETESNKEYSQDKYTRTDIQVRNKKGDMYIVEVQYTYEVYYFHRIVFGAAVAIKEYLKEKEKFDTIKRVISITIAYANLGEGTDYVYRGNNHFYGIHDHSELSLDNKQKEKYNIQTLKEIFPEYWIIRLKQYNDQIHDELDQWIYFFKNNTVKKEFHAKGLQKAVIKLDQLNTFGDDIHAYNEYLKYILSRNSEISQKEDDKKTIEEKNKAIEEKNKAIEEKDKTIEEKDKT
ncbi:MAG: PD-(D/E)XK nuclease family transposase, partial [Chitinophagaceae bacterium]|nr:PD-(D/E)XK nuclease family transposase [Chitinophagaceae bacterium]